MTQIFQLPGRICSTQMIQAIAAEATGKYVFLYLKPDIRWVHYAQERMLQIADDTRAVMLYSDHFDPRPTPLIDYQEGALRDDFDFGSVILLRTDALQDVAREMGETYEFAGFYDLRLRLSRKGKILHINEFLYYDEETDLRQSGEKLFDYVDPKNRAVQVEMEACVTRHLEAIGARIHREDYLPLPAPEKDAYPVTASVIIPCKNRVRTIGDAIRSALRQEVEAPYSYNVIVVDDNSTDGTVEVIEELKIKNEKLIYIAQDKTWHAIGGNWNAAVHHPLCGKYAIQLDSDDMYSDVTTVQKFIDAFESPRPPFKGGDECENCESSLPHYAMVIGSYQITDIDGNILPPGKIDHSEWTDENGMNNALRINGLGAPRAFYVPLLRTMNFPTTKYGEDYAVGLRICRNYPIGRIWDVVYNCRRWEDNSDANCDTETMNRNNLYKDRIRTWELLARIKN